MCCAALVVREFRRRRLCVTLFFFFTIIIFLFSIRLFSFFLVSAIFLTLLPRPPTLGSVVHYFHPPIPPTHTHRTLTTLPDVVCLFAFSRQFIFIYFYSIRKEEGRRWWVLEGRKKEGKKEGEKEREKRRWEVARERRGRRRLDVAATGRPISVGTTLKPWPRPRGVGASVGFGAPGASRPCGHPTPSCHHPPLFSPLSTHTPPLPSSSLFPPVGWKSRVCVCVLAASCPSPPTNHHTHTHTPQSTPSPRCCSLCAAAWPLAQLLF